MQERKTVRADLRTKEEKQKCSITISVLFHFPVVNQRYGLLFIVGGSAAPISTLLNSTLCYARHGGFLLLHKNVALPNKEVDSGSKNKCI